MGDFKVSINAVSGISKSSNASEKVGMPIGVEASATLKGFGIEVGYSTEALSSMQHYQVGLKGGLSFGRNWNVSMSMGYKLLSKDMSSKYTHNCELSSPESGCTRTLTLALPCNLYERHSFHSGIYGAALVSRSFALSGGERGLRALVGVGPMVAGYPRINRAELGLRLAAGVSF